MDDRKIIELFFERSEQAIVELSEKYGALCRKIAGNILRDPLDAEECINDAYLGVWNSIPPKRPDSLPGYVARIVRNLSLKKYHEKAAKKRNSIYDVALEEIADCLEASFSVEDEISARETAGMISRYLGTLEARDRVMFVRRYWYADSLEDLAALFHKSRHYISVRLSRIRKGLARYLKEEGVLL